MAAAVGRVATPAATRPIYDFAASCGLAKAASKARLALVLLNSPEEVRHDFVSHLVDKSDIVIFGDGGWQRYRRAIVKGELGAPACHSSDSGPTVLHASQKMEPSQISV